MEHLTITSTNSNGRISDKADLKTKPSLRPEIWEGILMELPLEDFLSAINSSLEWNQLVHAKKTVKLLPLIIPLVMEYLPLNTVLSLRLVDKCLFKQTIDTVLQTLSTNLEKAFEYKTNQVEHFRKFLQGKLSLPSKFWLLRRRYDFSMTEVNQRFLSKILPPPPSCPASWSPILSNYVSITHPVTNIAHFEPDRPGESVEGEQALASILPQFGRHVLSLELKFAEFDFEVPVSLRKLLPTLSKFPNLKILKLDAQVGVPNSELRYLSQERLPALPKLEYLSLKRFHWEGRYFHRDPDPTIYSDVPVVLPVIQKYGAQLKVLKCGGAFLAGREATVQLLNELLPNLKYVEVDSVNPQSMIKLGMVTWKLEKLIISGFTLDGRRCCRLAHLVAVLNNFRENLRSLEVVMSFADGKSAGEPKDQVEKGVMKPLLKLKKVRTSPNNLGTDWFWETFTSETCPVLEQLEFLRQDLSEPRYMVPLSEYKRAFRRIPTLKKIIVWFEDKPRLVIRCRIPSCREKRCVGNCPASYQN